ncbi:MAG TPA: BamA/TamA family outer membrane protein [Verrucomicrobiae bacterium]|nr:BamA/TamA family outer membrane protein [Verrucomicrobiae bacterium]
MICCVFALFLIRTNAAESSTNVAPAKLKVSGYGFFGDLQIKRMLGILNEGKKKPEFFDANFIEDASLLILSRLRDDGYLRPVLRARVVLEDGREVSLNLTRVMEEPLPRPLRATRVRFEIRKGLLYYFRNLEFSGLHAISEKQARRYFIETGGLLSLKGNRIYSPDQLKHSVENLTSELQRLGFHDATVTVADFKSNDHTGEVDARIEVSEGAKYFVRSVREEIRYGNETEPAEVKTNWPAQPYSKIWEQDFAQSIRTNFYRQGYPDAAVALEITNRIAGTNEVHLDFLARVSAGPRVRVGKVSFTGYKHTRKSVIERRASIKTGEWLNRIRAERARYRLSRLGVFDSVELQYHAVDEHTRDVNYLLHEGKQIDVNLLFGYGSYELLRGGVQLDQYNVFGLAHHQELKLIQSFKSSSADYTYTMPEFFGENMDVFLNASGLRREEISFTRLEYGGGIGVRQFFKSAGTDVSARYNYQILHASDASAAKLEGLQNSRAAAIITDITRDKRDNPLYPRHGYKLFSDIEIASDYLGGNVNYQRLDLSTSWHLPLSDSQWLHLGLSHGFVATVGSASKDLPFNRRFFPGGENSIRGYQEGEAAPRNSHGKIVGAETYTLANIEFEQALTPKWSLVAFLDSLGFARRLEDYPMNEELFSAGGGISWKTFIGPVRLEYGYNLNPRKHDPIGTLQFSLGFPF